MTTRTPETALIEALRRKLTADLAYFGKVLPQGGGLTVKTRLDDLENYVPRQMPTDGRAKVDALLGKVETTALVRFESFDDMLTVLVDRLVSAISAYGADGQQWVSAVTVEDLWHQDFVNGVPVPSNRYRLTYETVSWKRNHGIPAYADLHEANRRPNANRFVIRDTHGQTVSTAATVNFAVAKYFANPNLAYRKYTLHWHDEALQRDQSVDMAALTATWLELTASPILMEPPL